MGSLAKQMKGKNVGLAKAVAGKKVPVNNTKKVATKKK